MHDADQHTPGGPRCPLCPGPRRWPRSGTTAVPTSSLTSGSSCLRISHSSSDTALFSGCGSLCPARCLGAAGSAVLVTKFQGRRGQLPAWCSGPAAGMESQAHHGVGMLPSEGCPHVAFPAVGFTPRHCFFKTPLIVRCNSDLKQVTGVSDTRNNEARGKPRRQLQRDGATVPGRGTGARART